MNSQSHRSLPSGPLAGSDRWLVTHEYTRLRLCSEVHRWEPLKRLVDEARRYVNEWKSLESQMDSFWHRKSSKIVLAVVMVVEKGRLRFYRGMNSEISLPSGSNCAERSAISTCISNMLTVRRSDFRAIAVVDPKDELNPVFPCGVCDEWLKKLQEESPMFSIVTFTTSECDAILERCPPLGFQYNTPLVASCQQCRTRRFRSRPRNRVYRRIKVMGLIKNNCPEEARDTNGVDSGVLPDLDVPKTFAGAAVSFKGHSVVNLGHTGTVKGMTAACSTKLTLADDGMGVGNGTFTLCFEQSLASGGEATGSKKLLSGVYRVEECDAGIHDTLRIALQCTEMSGKLVTAHTTAFERAHAFRSEASFSLHVDTHNSQASLSIANHKDQLMFTPYPKELTMHSKPSSCPSVL
ncbi:unnamed protein product [Vitrella brassicaformis CCMP3155]|uniref:Uncharacterized protein n=1 Tax=Vitrella brassicaformis (strain CCMP3155) TaxID=1169540 RepID=A0A0G4EQ48_VITBC|nr:unnamed protein product [Vitrella brassicaformis CCMP3155]|eukprot:CEL99527.1 unnamed protein product [Vitrella brassicaformis CCMP3155]